jgi:hypothetical protein
MANLIRGIGYVLLIGGAVFIVAALAGFYIRWGTSGLADVLSPFNVWNLIAIALTLAPGALLIGIGDLLATRRQPARSTV